MKYILLFAVLPLVVALAGCGSDDTLSPTPAQPVSSGSTTPGFSIGDWRKPLTELFATKEGDVEIEKKIDLTDKALYKKELYLRPDVETDTTASLYKFRKELRDWLIKQIELKNFQRINMLSSGAQLFLGKELYPAGKVNYYVVISASPDRYGAWIEVMHPSDSQFSYVKGGGGYDTFDAPQPNRGLPKIAGIKTGVTSARVIIGEP